jgi:hypothetical protein
VNDAIGTLESKLFSGDKLNSELLNEQDIYDLSIAGLGAKAAELQDVSEDDLVGDNVWAKNITSLVGKFATIKASQITGVDQLIADKIDAINISTEQLDTKPTETSNAGRITIKDNDVIIYDADGETPSIVLTGSTQSAYDKSSSENTHTITGHIFEIPVNDSDAFYLGVTQKLFTTDDVLNTGDAYVFKNTNINGLLT